MDEIEALTKRFKDYIDKVQATVDAERQNEAVDGKDRDSGAKATGKLYTVISPVEAVADNLKSVLKAIDHAIDHIDEISEDRSQPKPESREVYSSEPRKKRFTEEELDFLVQTFNKILNTTEEERKILFSQFDKTGESRSK